MVSRRPFSGYWEYHIEDALFTAPARTDHSGAGLFNAEGELVGVGSLVVGNASDGSGPAMRGNMFVPVDLLKPILAELKARGSSRNSNRAWLGLNCVEVDGQIHVVRLSADSPAEAAGLQPKDVIVAVDGVRVADLASMYRTLWRGDRPDRDVIVDILRDGEAMRLPVHAVDRMMTLSRPRGV
jgi:S1-C subfamily serine protease